MILESVESGPLIWPSIVENRVTRPKKYSELSATEALQADCDIKATNIILQGLPPEVYALVSNHKVAKELWERIQLLMQGTSLTKQEKGVFMLIWDNMNCPCQMSFRLMHERNSDPLALVATHQMTQSPYQTHQNSHQNTQFQPQVSSYQSPQYGSPYQSQQYSTHQSSTPLSITYPSNDYQSSIHHNIYSPSSSIPQLEYPPSVDQQSEFSQQESGLIVPVFQKGDDPIDAINHMMSFLTAVVTSRETNFYSGAVFQTYTPRASGNNSGKQRTVICYNCKGEGHMSKQCNKPKRKRDDSWFKDKVLLVQAQASGQILHEEELAFLADPGIPEGQAHRLQKLIMPAYQAEDWMIVDSDCDELNTAKVALIANYLKLWAMPSSEHSNSCELFKTEITIDSNIIPYSHSSEPDLSDRPTNVEVPKELPKVSMVNTSLKKLKYHLANFDVDLFSTFNQQLVDELAEVQNVFYQMEQAVEQHRVESKTFEVKMNQALNENERLLEQVMSKDIVNLMVNSSMDFASVNVLECEKCLKLETELQKDFVEKEIYDKLFKRFTTLEKHCISLEVDTQLNQEIFQRDNSISNQSAPSFDQLFELNELKAQSQEKDMEEAAVLRDLVEQVKSKYLLDHSLESACRSVQIVLRYLDSGCYQAIYPEDRSQLTNRQQILVQSNLEMTCGKRIWHRSLIFIDWIFEEDNLYTLSLVDMMASSPICLLSKASKTKSWLWHRRLSHLNFGAINHLARHGLVCGLPKLKFEKDHLVLHAAMGRTRNTPQPKSKTPIKKNSICVHIDLCGPTCVSQVFNMK
ncbi:retrovirus-related pol polyprotein from transposon TNT 1-94 [Tanacetum coccineum]